MIVKFDGFTTGDTLKITLQFIEFNGVFFMIYAMIILLLKKPQDYIGDFSKLNKMIIVSIHQKTIIKKMKITKYKNTFTSSKDSFAVNVK